MISAKNTEPIRPKPPNGSTPPRETGQDGYQQVGFTVTDADRVKAGEHDHAGESTHGA